MLHHNTLPRLFAALACLLATPVVAADKVTFLTSWFAEAEHGGFYEAKALGLYEKAGLDVTIRMGGPQVNGVQLLAAGETDLLMGFDLQVLKGRERNLPLVTVATSFQRALDGLMAHDDVKTIEELRGKPILIATSVRQTFWPWLRTRYGFTDDQARTYTFNLQPFVADTNVATQGYVTSEPFAAAQSGVKTNFFLLGDYGYPPYGTTIVATDGFVRDHPDVVARFVKATLEGWKAYLADPTAGDRLIKIDNPKMTDAQLAYAVAMLRDKGLVTGGDAAQGGIGIMTEARWKANYDFMVENKLLDPAVDWRAAYTDRFVRDLHVR